MIGADTLRFDRLGQVKNNIDLTPHINKLINQGTLLTNCITPLARTAPSLASLFTGLWPHHHKIRSNFLYPSEFNLPKKTLIQILKEQDYYTATVSDWAGSDFGKINFGFDEIQVPKDQWNLKLLIRQGPPLLRLFLSLFTHNRFGKKFLPELYYLAGIPLTQELGRDFRQLISNAAKKDKPFFLNLFTSTTHVPFGSEYPYYNLFTPKDYAGDSRFIMTKLATPEEIMHKQELGVEAFDLPQILNLYDGCVKQFDDEVGKIIEFVDNCGLTENTVFIVYSDHGADFFETGCWGQGNTLRGNDPSGRIPVVLKGPKIPENLRFNHVTRSVDIMPTLLALLAMESAANLDGVNLLPDLCNNSDPELYAFQETGEWLAEVPGMHPAQLRYPNIVDLLDIPDKKAGTLVINQQLYDLVIRAKNRSVQNKQWKLIYIPTHYGIEYELYDLQSDPNCEFNQVKSHVEIFNQLKTVLEQWMKEDSFSDLKSPPLAVKNL
jgi:arylsulfatase A-like enzyme